MVILQELKQRMKMYFISFFHYTCINNKITMKANSLYIYMCCCYEQTGEGMLSNPI
jgi:hypothetical protein